MVRSPLKYTAIFATLAVVGLASCTKQTDETRETNPTGLFEATGKADRLSRGGLTTNELHEAIVLKDDKRALEASGVASTEDGFVVVLDNDTGMIKLDTLTLEGEMVAADEVEEGYEGLTFDAEEGRYYALIEASGKKNRPEVHVYDKGWTLLQKEDVDFSFDSANKGMEGIAHKRVDGALYLFMLCEQNDCEEKGKQGEGRVHVFAKKGDTWSPVDKIKLPESWEVEDYSGLDVVGDRIVVSSQEDASIWLGTLEMERGQDGSLDWKVAGDGVELKLPENRSKKKIFCNVEGVSFVDQNTLLLVSDRRKPEQNKRCEDRDEAFHLLTLP